MVVVSVAAPKEFSGNPVVNFSARKEGEEGAAGYETWGQELVDLVKKDARLDCEVTYIPKQDKIVNRVTQMFDAQGKPIRQPRQRAGGRSYGKSDFQIMVERVSIEGQSAYNGVIELVKTGKTEGWTKEVETARQYAELKMREGMKPITMPKPAPEPVSARSAQAETEPKKTATETKEKISEETVEELRKLAKEKGYTKETSAPLLKMFNVESAKDLTVPQGERLKELMEKGKGLPEQQPLG